MGMSSSQARLLNLTARMHQIEYKAARLEAQKLQMANESAHVYNDYLNALEQSKLQFKMLNHDGSVTFKDATLKALENGHVPSYIGDTLNNTLFLQDTETGRILLTSEVANQYGLEGKTENRDLYTFIRETTGKTKTKVIGYTPITNVNMAQSLPVHSTNYTLTSAKNSLGGINYSALNKFTRIDETHKTVSATDITETDTFDTGSTYKISSAAGLQRLLNASEIYNMAGVTFILSNDIDMSSISNWSGIKNFCGTFDGNGYVISNLTGSQGLFDSVGLIEFDESGLATTITGAGTVKNTLLENVNINGNSNCIGGLIGFAVGANIDNCYVTGSIKNSINYSYNKKSENENNNTFSQNNQGGTGGLIGCVTYSGEITNCYTNANVQAANSDCVGGLLGYTYTRNEFNIANCYSITENDNKIVGKDYVGGLIGSSYYDQDTASIVTDINMCYAGCNVQGGNNVGGFIGDFLYWGDLENQACEINNCQSTSVVSGNSGSLGAFFGTLRVKLNGSISTSELPHYKVNVNGSGYVEENGPDFGRIIDEDENAISRETYYSGGDSSIVLATIKIAGSIPSMSDYRENIMNVLIKGRYVDPEMYKSEDDVADIYNKIDEFLNNYDDSYTSADGTVHCEDNTKLFYMNEYIMKYLGGTDIENTDKTTTTSSYTMGNEKNQTAFTNALAAAVLDEDYSSIGLYQVYDTSLGLSGELSGDVQRKTETGTAYTGSHSDTKGVRVVPSNKDIADQLYSAFYMADFFSDYSTVPEWQNKILEWINTNYSTSNNDDMISLANIANSVRDVNILSNVYDAINYDQKYVDTTFEGDIDEWIFTQSTSNSVGGSMIYDWELRDPVILDAAGKWILATQGAEVVDDDIALSNEWLTNMLEAGKVVLTYMNPEKFSALGELDVDELVKKEPSERSRIINEILEVENTSVSTNTSVQSVNNETNLKKAEAKYEADMKRIDRKDRQYDTQLAACETERNAIKQEMETLKTVAKDNADRTFKLFS